MANLSDRITRFENALDGAISLAASKKEFIGKQIVNAFLLFIILLVFGCLDFAKLEFHFEYLADVNYWITVGTKTIAGICAFNIGINIMWEIEIRKDKILAKAIDLYNRVIVYKKIDFEYFIVRVYNPAEKKKAYISQINKQIHSLNKFSRRKDRLLYSSDLPERQEEKLKNRYCIKRKQLEDLKNPEFIEKNLDSLKVKYSEIDPAVFDLEIDGTQTYHGKKVKGNVGGAKAKATSSMVLGMVGFSMLMTSIGLTVNQEQLEGQMVAFANYLLKCCEDVGIVLWQALRGMLKARGIISSEFTKPFIDRNAILRSYYTWKKENDTTCADWIDKALGEWDKDVPKEEIEIELTEEEYKAYQDK